MKAAMIRDAQTIDVVDMPIPSLSQNEALIKVKYAGICGSDITLYDGNNPRAKNALVPGHEFVGEIVDIDNTIETSFNKYDRVAVIPTLVCGECSLCKTRKRHLCKSLKFIGIQTNGGFAEYVTVPLANLIHIPDELSYKKAVLAEPLSVAIHAVDLGGVNTEDKIVILGAGPIGLLVAISAKFRGAKRIILSEISRSRVKIAKQFGYKVVDAKEGDLSSVINDISQNKGADVVFECTGHPSTLNQLIDIGKFKAQLVIVGAYKEPAPVDLFRLSRKEQSLVGSWTYTRDNFNQAIKVLSESNFPFENLITDIFTLDDTYKALEKVKRAEDSIKVLIKVAEI